MAVLRRLALLLLAARAVLCPDPSLLDEARELSELPLDKLLHVKQAFCPAPPAQGDGSETPAADSHRPEAMALTGAKGGDWSARGARGKAGTPSLFQGTVTTLAFLAFGGYILCLAVSAARANSAALRGLGAGRRRRRRDASPGAEHMLAALHTLAEGYAAYHAAPAP